jgi:hypothetical protein
MLTMLIIITINNDDKTAQGVEDTKLSTNKQHSLTQ